MSNTAKKTVEQCIICHNPGKYQIGLPTQRVPLCGVHLNQLKKMMPPLKSVNSLERWQIRKAFGFVILDVEP